MKGTSSETGTTLLIRTDLYNGEECLDPDAAH